MNEFRLSAIGCPPGVNGIFYLGNTQIQLPFGEGFRCIGGTTPRISPGVTTDGAGQVSLELDFTLPYGTHVQGGGPGVNYQFYYRDLAGGPAGFNLSDALRVYHLP